MITYLSLSNIPKSSINAGDIHLLIDLIKKDKRVLSFELLDVDNVSFIVNLNLGKNEIYFNKILSFGAFAGLLNSPRWQCALNSEKIKDDANDYKDALLLFKNSQINDVNKLLAQFETSIDSVMYVINCFKTGRRINETRNNNNALDLIQYNVDFGTGNWFIFTDNYKGIG